MKVKFWGVRGSIPSPGPATVRYGGNTTCIEIRTDQNELIIIDAGTGIREYLLDYLMLPSLRPDLLIIIDAGYLQTGAPGEVRECSPTAIQAQKIHDFSLHQFPTVNLLRELQEETGIEVVLLIAQTAVIPDHIAPGLSMPMLAAVEDTCHRILRIIARYATLEATAS